MSDTDQLLVVLAALYLFDCLHWVRRGTLSVRRYVGSSFQIDFPSRAVGNVHAGIVWAHPLPPLGSLFTTSSWPLGPSREGVCALEPLEWTPGPRDVFRTRARRWSEIREIARDGTRILIDDEVWGYASSEREAADFTEFLEHLRESADESRAGAIDAALASSLDPERVVLAVSAFERRIRLLRVLCCAMLFFLFGALPVVLHFLGLDRTWLALLATLLLLQSAIVLTFVRVHGARRPGFAGALVQLAVSPPQAARAVDLAARGVLSGVHPLAAVQALAPNQRTAVVRAICVDAWFPRTSRDADDAFATRCADAYRAHLRGALRERMAQLGLDPRDVLAAPEPDDASRRSFCPRCALQFERDDAQCDDCSTPAVSLSGPLVV